MACLLVFLKSHPVSGDVSCIAHGDAQPVRGFPKGIDDLEGCGLLTLQSVGIDRIHQGHGVPVRRLPNDVEGSVEVAADRKDLCAVHQSLGQLSLGDVAVRDQDECTHASTTGVGRRCCRGISGARADHSFTAGFLGLADGHGHAAVLERPGWIQAVVFHMDGHTPANALGHGWHWDQRCRPFSEGDHRGGLADR